MTDLNLTFKTAFWESDFLSLTAFETLSNHIKSGQKSCKWLEECLRQRAKAEEDYSKMLLKISRHSTYSFGTLGLLIDELQKELEAEAMLHSSVACKLTEESNKLSEFRMKQKETKKRHEEVIRKVHKLKADSFRNIQTSKQACEARVRNAIKAKSEVDKLKVGTKLKEAVKVKKNFYNSSLHANKANDQYHASVTTTNEARKNWEREYLKMCDEFQKMEETRIAFMRNSVWVFTNLVSDLCCQVDDSREKVRLVAEECDEEADTREFVLRNGVSSTPLPEVRFEPLSWFAQAGEEEEGVYAELSLPVIDGNGNANQAQNNGADPEWDNEEDNPPDTDTYEAEYDYAPQSVDELELTAGDFVQVLGQVEEGWMQAVNLSSNNSGLVPLNYLRKCRN